MEEFLKSLTALISRSIEKMFLAQLAHVCPLNLPDVKLNSDFFKKKEVIFVLFDLLKKFIC
jgi:hypothetical protein